MALVSLVIAEAVKKGTEGFAVRQDVVTAPPLDDNLTLFGKIKLSYTTV